MSQVARRDGWEMDPSKALAGPLLVAPAAFRPAISKLWILNQHMLGNALPLAARVRQWVDELGLTLPEFQGVCARLCEPDRQATHQYAGQLLADLSGLISAAVKERRGREEMLKRRAESTPGNGPEIRKLLHGPKGFLRDINDEDKR